MSQNDMSDFLESNVPASIDIEEMIVGRFTARQLTYLCVGALTIYNSAFKISNHYMGALISLVVATVVYFLGFYKMKKYDMRLDEFARYYFIYKKEQQVFINK